VRLVQASGGLFEVSVDGQLVFSKKALRRHAAPGEVRQAIERLRSGK
jgi:selT/selW/selH-like putative selenoprotein